MVIVTGGNSGHGFASAQQFLAKKASTVILACRTVSKAEAARLEILHDHEVRISNPNDRMLVTKLVMEPYDSVLKFSNRFRKALPAIDVQFLNAGVGEWTYAASPTGHERVL